jgi:pyruvate dehydrogenase (quinone)/pyruvate oxidase
MSTNVQQDVALYKIFGDACVYNELVMGPAHIENVIDLAIKTALARKKPAHITIPVDIQNADIKVLKSFRNIPKHSKPNIIYDAKLPDNKNLKAAAELLNSGRKIAILAGQGALHAGRELETLAEKCNAMVAKALLGKAVLPDDSPFVTGQLGLLGTKPSQDLMEECDTLLIAGSSFPYLEFLP